MTQGGRGKKRCHFPPEGDTIGNAITRKCKLGMLTYIAMGISLCPSEWYQSAKFRVLAHALKGFRCNKPKILKPLFQSIFYHKNDLNYRLVSRKFPFKLVVALTDCLGLYTFNWLT